MHRRRPIVLITGFGPFPGMRQNVSARLVPALAREARRAFPAYRFEDHVLATEWVAGPERVGRLYEALSPIAAIHFGVSSRARGFEIELRGYNRQADVLDACGAMPASACISEHGPETLPSRLPTGLILQRLRQRGIPATLSWDAGRYLCNALLYRAIDHARRADGGLRAGFIHLPSELRGDGGRSAVRSRSALDWHQAMAGALEIIAATLRQPPVGRWRQTGRE